MDDLIISPMAQAEIRQTALQWALSTARNGEAQSAIMARAEAYLAFVTHPLRRDRVAAAEAAFEHSLTLN